MEADMAIRAEKKASEEDTLLESLLLKLICKSLNLILTKIA